MKRIRITVGDWAGYYMAATGRDAIRLFFKDILKGKIKLCQLSVLGEWNDGTEPIPFRIGPALFKAKMISAQDLWDSFRGSDLDFEPIEVMAMIQDDSWMVEQ